MPFYGAAPVIVVLALAAIIGVWQGVVNSIVPEPYLDEVFHVGQAQTYCAGRFNEWDPKITTPPGLYFASWLLQKIRSECSTQSLRAGNSLFMLFGVFATSFWLRLSRRCVTCINLNDIEDVKAYLEDTLTALNITLFPPLFFFSALYYTDIASTGVVLLAIIVSLSKNKFPSPFAYVVLSSITGMTALFFRQTNVFWVAIFLAGNAIRTQLSAMPSDKVSKDAGNIIQLIKSSWDSESFFDPLISEASFGDFFKTFSSLTTALSSKLLSCVWNPGLPQNLDFIMTLTPFALVLGAFVGFVLWNGGVVLGDKSNHVATVHIPQILYLCPYIVFFSLPLVYPYFLSLVLPQKWQSRCMEWNGSGQRLLRLSFIGPFVVMTLLGCIIVRYNTIVHPFTLADNRHYVFYVFRLLLRHPYTKYLAVPAYLICGWAFTQSLDLQQQRQSQQQPQRDEQKKSTEKIAKTIAKSSGKPPEQEQPVSASDGCTVSFFIIWLGTTTLCLVFAPLVEPRYCIIPWIVWRLQVPTLPRKPSSMPSPNKTIDLRGWKTALASCDHRLFLETAWLCTINLVTGYVFLNRGFTWLQEPGKIQRFMW